MVHLVNPLDGLLLVVRPNQHMERIWLSMAAQQAVLWHYPLGSVQPLWAARLMAAL
jgi:hypothetical protein